MKTIAHFQGLMRAGTRLMLGVALLVGSYVVNGIPVLAAPASRPAAAILPASTCTLTAGTFSCDLWAMTGTVTLPGLASPVTIWGYATTSAGPAALPGPTLIVTQGMPVSITLHNVNLPSATSLSISGQPIIPDTTGVTLGNNTTYSFEAGILKPGTYLYEAGLTADGPRQVAMGLYGALIVRPTGAPSQAYSNPNTTFTDEAVLVLSEIDPAFNADPVGFDMSKFAPKYWLINGKGYPNTDPIPTAAGNTVLLRYINAGLQHHSMGLLGLRQMIIATEAQPATNPSKVVAETIPTGGTLDAIITVPASAPANAKYALFEAAMHMDNKGISTSGLINFGGMLTFLTVAGVVGTNVGPVTSAVAIAPNPTNGGVASTLSASITDADGVNAAEYFVDAIGVNGAGCSISVTPATTVNVSAVIPTTGGVVPCVDLTTLSSGNHTFYVHGQDALGAWGTVASVVLNLDKTGPAISNTSLAPSPTNGTADVQVQATASDAATGNQNVTAAEYFIDPVGTPAGGTGTPITVATPATAVSLNATIISTTVNGLAQGNHTVAIRAQDALGNWGAFGTIALVVDKTSPAATGVAAQPNPNNGTLGVQVGSVPGLYLRIDATLADPVASGVNSNIAAGEYYIDIDPGVGHGGVMVPVDGAFNSPSEAAYGAVDLIALNQLGVGTHTICVRGKDAAGNWGSCTTTTLLIDRAAPTFTSITLAPNPTVGAATVVLTVTGAADTGGAGVAGGEYWINPPTTVNPAPGSGTPFSGLTANIPVNTLPTGTYVVSARIRDAAGNWSNTISTATLTVVPNTIFINGFDTGGSPWGWSSASTNNTTRLSVSAAAAQSGARGLQAQGNNTNYVQFNFGTPANPATATYDARFYFNPHGNTGSNQDAFAAATSNAFGTILFHVRYRWNGGSPQVQIQVGNTANATWSGITNNAFNPIEVVWQSASTLQLYVNGSLVQTLTATTGSVAAVRLGSVTSGGNATLEYFDTFASKRLITPLIGP